MRARTIVALLLATPLLASAVSPPSQRITVADYRAARAHLSDEESFQHFLDKLPTVTVDQGGASHRYYLFEGDLLLSREEVRNTLRDGAGSHPNARPRKGTELIVSMEGNGPAIWPVGHRALTYDIDKSSFPDDATYQQVVGNMTQAARDWVAACPTCGVSITRIAAHDAAPHEGDATFIVSYSQASTDVIAVSFFPSDPVQKRHLYVFPGYLTTSFDHVGVLRHELGHVLGYRHEHIRKEAGCQSEDGAWKPLSPYDPHSVMHYYCGNGGTLSLKLTDFDKTSHRNLYLGRKIGT